MIPLKLGLRNFMCYGKDMPAVDFGAFHIACLCGANGHGKSALLDAITWVLWGKSRARDDDDLIHQGQSEMEVDFEFAVDGKRFRVVRKHEMAGPKRARQASLDLLVSAEDGFKTINGDSRQQTQEKLTGLLHMDYETFINSSFLIQGRANAFSLKQPAQRKEVLSNILGLSFYDEVVDSARQFARSRHAEGENLEQSIGDLALEVAKIGEYQAELERARESAAGLEAESRAAEADLARLRAERDALEMRRVTLVETEKRLQNAALEQVSREAQRDAHRSKVEAYEKVVADRASAEKGYQQLLGARKAVDEWNERLQGHNRLREQMVVLEMEIARAREEIVGEVKVCQSLLQQENGRAAQLPGFERELAGLQAQLDGLADAEQKHGEKTLRIQELNGELARLRAERVRLERETKAAQEKVSLLLQGHARCPLCETDLGDDGIRRLGEKLRQEVLEASEAVRVNDVEQGRLVRLQSALILEAGELQKAVGRQGTLKQRAVLLEKAVHEATDAAAGAEERKRKLEKLEVRLQGKDYAPARQESASALRAELQRLGYSETAHADARGLLKRYEGCERARQALEEADRELPQRREWLASDEDGVNRLRREIDEETSKLQCLKRELVALPQVEKRVGQATADCARLGAELSAERQRVGAFEERLRRCTDMANVKAEKERALRVAREEESIFQELGEAFGKKGVQAVLIERALPEIEEEASRLLGLMSDSRFSLRINTQEPKKSGKGTIETFDIMVADELGTRKYEMFSGGEAFRIDLALRLALSKLLARRAGAPMRTLVIDEGFGTQDASGRERLVEAINSIQGEFDRIIVVTHIEELKDAFPIRLDVVKTVEGSTVTVS